MLGLHLSSVVRHRYQRKMAGMDTPLLVVVTGPPGAGKTTLARALGIELRLPLVAKDDVKETLFDALGWSDRAWSRRVGVATYDLLFLVLRELLRRGVAAIVESNFAEPEPLRALPPHRAVQVFCSAPAELLLERYAARPRHPGHVDEVTIAEIEPRIRAGEWRPLALDGPLLELDTSGPVDVPALAAEILRA
jgi:predicted kinase